MTIKKLLLALIFVGVISNSHGQKSRKSFFFPSKIGIQFVQGNENNFLFDDNDYFYRTQIIKGQFYYPLTHFKTVHFSLIVNPQVQLIQHQLYNEHFVRPDESNYLEKRQKFTQLKNLSLTALELSFEAKQLIFKGFSVFLQASVGVAYIDTATERLAKGFTFIENGNVGFELQLNSKTSLQLFGGVGHVSNFNFSKPNAGYNIFNTGLSLQYSLQ